MWILPKQLIASNGATAMAETISDLNELSQACAASLLVRSKVMRSQIWLLKWKPDTWTRFLVGRIVKLSHAKIFQDSWICSLRAILASRSVPLANAEVRMTRDISGHLCGGQLRFWLGIADGEQEYRNDARGFQPGIVRASDLDNARLGSDGSEFIEQQKECAEEFQGGNKLEHSKESGDGSVSTGPWSQGQGTSKSDWPSEIMAVPERSRIETSGPHEITSWKPNKSGESGLADCASIGRTERDTQPVGKRKGKAAQKERRGLADSNQNRPWHWPGFVSRHGGAQHEWEPPRGIGVKRGLGGGVNGRSANVDRLRLLGNGVYPAAAAKAFVTLYKRMKQ